MPRTDSERIAFYQTLIDAIDDALSASSGNADVVTYTTGDGRTVTRNRMEAQREIDLLEKRIQKLQIRENGSAVNYARLGGRS